MTLDGIFSRHRVAFGAAALLAAGATLTACGGSTLDAEKLNETITSQVNATDPNVSVTVSCPEGVELGSRGQFRLSRHRGRSAPDPDSHPRG